MFDSASALKLKNPELTREKPWVALD